MGLNRKIEREKEQGYESIQRLAEPVCAGLYSERLDGVSVS